MNWYGSYACYLLDKLCFSVDGLAVGFGKDELQLDRKRGTSWWGSYWVCEVKVRVIVVLKGIVPREGESDLEDGRGLENWSPKCIGKYLCVRGWNIALAGGQLSLGTQ